MNISNMQSLKLAKILAKSECPSITYLSEEFPVFWNYAKGCYVWDVDNNRFLDMNSSFGVCGLGHCNEKISEIIAEQSKKLIHGMGDVHPPQIKAELCELLLSTLPKDFGRVILSSNGSDACESAIKTMLLYNKEKPEIIAFKGAYHGLGLGSLNLTHNDFFRKDFQTWLPKLTHFVDFPVKAEEIQIVLTDIKNIIQKSPIGAIIIEPIQARGGVKIAAKNFLKELRLLCNENNILLIFDEIYTGLCRTGDFFAFEFEEVMPDLLCLGKLLGGGLPLSACIGKTDVMLKAWKASAGEAIHTSTFLGNPLICKVACFILNELKEKKYNLIVKEKGKYLKKILEENFSEIKEIKEIRGRGLMFGIEFHDKYKYLAKECMIKGLEEGLILLPEGPEGEVLSISPPFIINHEELDFAINKIKKILTN